MGPGIGSSTEVAVFVGGRVFVKNPEVVIVHTMRDAGVTVDAGSVVMSSGVKVFGSLSKTSG